MQQRDFTTTETLDLESAGFTTYENMAWLESKGLTGVQVFAVGDNLYLLHQETSCEVHFRDNLRNVIGCARILLGES